MTQPLLSSSHLVENHRERDPARAAWAEVSGAGNRVQKAVLQTRQGGAPRAVNRAVLPDQPAAHPELTRCLLQATAACPKNYSVSAAVKPPKPSTFTQKRGVQHQPAHCSHPTRAANATTFRNQTDSGLCYTQTRPPVSIHTAQV